MLHHFWMENQCLELVFALLWQASQRWLGERMSQFKQQQLLQLRRELGLLPPHMAGLALKRAARFHTAVSSVKSELDLS